MLLLTVIRLYFVDKYFVS